MPLPKWSSVAAKATEVYTEVWSVILQQVWDMSPARADDLTQLSKLLPYLRQLLTCCACAGLLDNAVISTSCGHCYCSECQFREPLLKIQCRQCRDRNCLVAETQLRTLVECYRHMCSILAEKVRDDPKLLVKLSSSEESDTELVENKSQAESSEPIREILKEVQEGVKVSRAVLVVKPPQKYLTPKLITPKKEQQPTTAARADKTTAALNSSPQGAEELDTPESRPVARVRSVRAKRRRVVKRPTPRKRARVEQPVDSGGEDESRERALPKPATVRGEASEKTLLQEKLLIDSFEQDSLDVCLSCLDSKYLKVSNNSVALKHIRKPEPPSWLREASEFSPEWLRLKVSEDGTRERVWSPLCPSVVVRRNRAIIDKTITQEEKAAQAQSTRHLKSKSKDVKNKPSVKPVKSRPLPLIQYPPPMAPPPQLESYEPPLPDDLSGLVLEKLEGEDPLPDIDKLLFRPPPPPMPLYPPSPFHPVHTPPFMPRPPMFSPLHHSPRFPMMMGPPRPPVSPMKPQFRPGLPKPVPKTPSQAPSTPKKLRKTPGYSEEGWRCRCGTNNVMYPEKVCAKGKCPCFSKGIPCKNCLCKHCHNPKN